MTTSEIISLIGLVGIGGILKSLLDLFLGKRRSKSEKKQEFKDTRYKAIILLSHAYIDYEKEGIVLMKHRPEITSKEILFNELRTEWVNMTLYASDKVILAMKKFLESSSKPNFNNMVLNMRKDLYGIRTKLKVHDLDLIENKSNL